MVKIFNTVAIGQAIVDVLAHVSADFVDKNNLLKGSTHHILQHQSDQFLREIHPIAITPGGTASNSLSGIAYLGGKVGYISRIANDYLGKIILQHLERDGITFSNNPIHHALGTGRCISLITPDADRTMVTYLGISHTFSEDDLDYNLLQSTQSLLVEGYQCETPSMFEATKKAVSYAKKEGAIIAMSSAHTQCMARYRHALLPFIQEFLDVFVSNEEEIMALTRTNSLELAKKEIRSVCPMTVITCGPKGAYIVTPHDDIFVPPPSVVKVVDTTGAGDQYLAGFLYALTQGKSLEECGAMASNLAGHIIQHVGGRPKRIDMMEYHRCAPSHLSQAM